MILNSIHVAFVLYLALLRTTFSMRVEKRNVIAGDSVILPCLNKDGLKPPLKVTWNYNGKRVIWTVNNVVFKDERSEKYGLKKDKPFPLEMTKAEPGQYSCDVDGTLMVTYDIEVWKVTGSKSGYLLQGDTLELRLSPFKDTEIEWLQPNKSKVTGKEPRWKLQKDRLQISNLTVQDHGIWECHVFHVKFKISYNVKVLGFSNPLDEFRFVAFNSSILLSCSLNINLQEKRDQEIPKVQSWKWLKNNIPLKDYNVSSINSSFSTQQISNINSEDAGKYQCHLGFKHGELSKTINLVVMKVSAVPPALRSKEDTVTLCGHISPSAPPLTELCWVYANESVSEPKCGSPSSEDKFCHVATTAGLWRCDLKVNNHVKISIDYMLGSTLSETTLGNRLSLIKIASGIGAVLLLLILIGVSVPTCKHIKQKQQQAKKMAQIKQHLLAKRTCQCQRMLSDDYYHT